LEKYTESVDKLVTASIYVYELTELYIPYVVSVARKRESIPNFTVVYGKGKDKSPVERIGIKVANIHIFTKSDAIEIHNILSTEFGIRSLDDYKKLTYKMNMVR
jgi:hypothetical protein